jgi:beta-galactosidase
VNRREFLTTSALALPLLQGARARAQSAHPSGRQVFPLNHNWLYNARNTPGAAAPDFDDSHFERVTLPHTNIVVPWHSFDEGSYQFISIYRRHFKLPAALKGQRVFIDFEGAMTASTVSINGHKFPEYKGGYTPFSYELTPHVDWSGDNVLAVELDSTERRDIPPFGGDIDYLTFGGIYREASLRITPQTYIENVFARPVDVLKPDRAVDVRVYLNQALAPGAALWAELRDGDRVVGARSTAAGAQAGLNTIRLTNLPEVQLWNLDKPKLYEVVVGAGDDEYRARIGFRDAQFRSKGFYLNGEHIKLRGLDRHQMFPYVGGAMPARAQRRDARILKDYHTNVVRTSHYPQSRHFLDACDELGLLVLEEIPGWQHIGENDWQDIAVRNVGEMVRRDWNHPSIILWLVRINESRDDHPFYVRTNKVAHELDPSRPTGGVRTSENYDSEFLEDVFTFNDFGFPLRPPNHPAFLNTEFVGHTYSTKRFDQVERVAEHTHRHARVHDQLASDDQYAGGLGWCAFDYNTHPNFGSGDHICYHGVFDIFRLPKAAAGFYRSQVDPAREIVLEPAFNWSPGDHSGAGGPGTVPVCSNCDHLKVYIDGKLQLEADPDRVLYPHLKYAPFTLKLENIWGLWGDLQIDGYIRGDKVISRKFSGKAIDRQLLVEPDDAQLTGDGRDVTRVVLRAADQYGNTQQFASGSVALSIEGPGEIIGENPFGLVGGAGAVWVRTKQASGLVRLRASHQYLGSKEVTIQVVDAPSVEAI